MEIYENKVSKYSNINIEIFNKIPSNSLVLDVGCGSGSLGKKLISEKHCKVYGIDISHKAIDYAKRNIDVAKQVNIEYEMPIFDKKFDVIIFGDILEHLQWPDLILERYKKFLKREGIIILSLPNVANIRIRFNLLLGKWDYTETGILDNTHLRFYTKKTIEEMISRNNFKILSYSFTPGFSFLFFRNNKKIQKLLGNLYPKLFALQFIYVIRENE